MNSLEQFFVPFIKSLKDNNIAYCVCGNYEHLPHYTDNDIDIWIDNHTLSHSLLLEKAFKFGFKLYLVNRTASGSNNFFYRQHEDTFQFLHVDLMTEGAWKSIFPLIPAKIFRTSIDEFKGFNVSNDQLSAAMHFIYPLVAFKQVRMKYRNEIKRHYKSDIFAQVLDYAVGERLSYRLLMLIQQSDWDELQAHAGECRKAVVIRSIPRLLTLAGIFRAIRFVTSTISRFIKPTGVSMAFIGPDGAGKTTIIESISPIIEKMCPRNMFLKFYWRPFLLPELNRIIPLRKPVKVNFDSTEYFYYRQRTVKGGIVKQLLFLLKFIYYWLDFIFGSLKILFITSRGGIACFDRYYYDQLVYPERFGFTISKKLIKVLANYIYRPNLVFVLCPSASTILFRKNEMPSEEVQRQVTEYLKIADEFNFNYLDTAVSIDNSTKYIISECLKSMSWRCSSGR